MIGKVLRGTRVEGLLYYLYGPGRANEHVNPHLVAGWRHPAELEPALRADGGRDFRNLIGLLNQPLAVLGGDGYDEPVWHCVARAARDDRVLDDDEWARVAHEIMNRTGLAASGDDDAVRWVSVRHADDHIHIVATLARQDGTKPKTWNDFYRVREACQAVERHYGLKVTAPGDRTAARQPTRSETEQARRRRWTEVPRITLRRHATTAAAGAASEEEFFRRLEASGVLVRKRFSQRTPGEVTGYAVALPIQLNRTGEPVWFGGGKLASDLTLPKLRTRWNAGRDNPASALDSADRRQVWDHAAEAAAAAATHIRRAVATDPNAAADIAGATSDLLHVASSVLKDRRLRSAADAFDRAAREPYARIGGATPAGIGLRRAARMLASAGATWSGSTLAAGAVVANIVALLNAVAHLRAVQGRLAQAVAARAAVQRLSRTAATGVAAAPRMAAADFPRTGVPLDSGPVPGKSVRSAVRPEPSARRRPRL
ncbi:relaxase/mobilization nuclease domain-containing protein [Planotetraspora mira]|uniref:MobA/VirD2-like nuclease domain-containing protein n=1 Tax=Planotetraspora mira TaxID=58121 RepID=A0A8J3U9G0_9ACTN|nr:relaxase/mobilization nuclease domain-containing protein [Planotetraspora mira]GII34980.1 hypothetical protein Pmi06nite_84220 [Planotetraspora mira]